MRSSPRAKRLSAWLGRWPLPSLILLLAYGLRLARIGAANLWWDEALAIWAVRKGLFGVTTWTAGDVHPPLYFWSLWGWVQVMGESEFAMRLLSLAFGVLTVAVVYRLGRLIAGPTAGALGAVLISLARFHVWWSQEMRMYVLAGLVGTISLYCLLRWLQDAENSPPDARRTLWWRRWPLIGYVIATTASLYTILLMGALVMVENVVVLQALVMMERPRRRRMLGQWVIAQLIILAALALWIAFSWGRMKTWSVASEPFGLLSFGRLYATLLATGVSVRVERYVLAAILPFGVLLVGGAVWLARWWPRRRQSHFAAWAMASLALTVALPPLVVYAASIPRGLFYTPQIEARYLLPFAPAFWLALGWGIVLIGQRWRSAGWACGIALVLMSVAFLPGYYERRYLHDDLKTMSRAIVSQARAGDVVLLDSGGRYPVFLYTYERTAPEAWHPPMETVTIEEKRLELGQVEVAMEALAETYDRVWLAEVDVNLTDPDRLVAQWLVGRYHEVSALRYAHNTLRLYAPDEAAPELAPGYVPQHPRAVETTAGGALRGWELPVTRFTRGDTIHVALLWDTMPSEPVAVSLADKQGRLLDRREVAGEAGATDRRQQIDLPVYDSTPAGRYDIVLSPAPRDGARLGTLCIAGTLPLPPAKRPAHTLNARVGDHVTLVGYTLQDDITQPGRDVTLDIHWRAEDKLSHNYTVFTHLLGQAHNPRTQGPVWGQHDSQPADNGYPTTQWLVGDTIVDRHPISVDENAPAGSYRIEMGMYLSENGQRMKIIAEDGAAMGDHLLLEEAVEVRAR